MPPLHHSSVSHAVPTQWSKGSTCCGRLRLEAPRAALQESCAPFIVVANGRTDDCFVGAISKSITKTKQTRLQQHHYHSIPAFDEPLTFFPWSLEAAPLRCAPSGAEPRSCEGTGTWMQPLRG
jgi:hypothetical protein